MQNFLPVLLAILLIALAIAGIAIKMLIKPGGTFQKTCGSKFDPVTGKAMPCSCHSEEPEECKGDSDKKQHAVATNQS